jgi:hypothetical protein
MSHFVRDLPFGATLLEKNRTRFRLWALQQAQMPQRGASQRT